jgi:hypothetical protein
VMEVEDDPDREGYSRENIFLYASLLLSVYMCPEIQRSDPCHADMLSL